MTNPTSGAAVQLEAGCSKHHLIHCSQCRHDNMVRDLRAENDRLTTQLAALAAGQATAALAGPTCICLVIDRPHDCEVEVSTDDVTGYGKTLREALDAARKQGGKP